MATLQSSPHVNITTPLGALQGYMLETLKTWNGFIRAANWFIYLYVMMCWLINQMNRNWQKHEDTTSSVNCSNSGKLNLNHSKGRHHIILIMAQIKDDTN